MMSSSSHTLVALALAAAAASTGCAIDSADATPPVTATDAPLTVAAADDSDAALERSGDATARPRRIARLKAAIRAVASANTTRTDNLSEVQRQLEPLIARLVAIAPRVGEAEKLARSVGPWRNLWSNLAYNGFPPDLTRVFQVVTDAGHYWNLSQAPAPVPGVGAAIGALRGAYAPIPAGLAIRFTTDGVVSGTLVGRTGADLVALADGIEATTVPLIPLPGGGVAPLRITGTLTTAYVDADLRIIGGDSAPRFDDNGVVEIPGQYGLRFVLDRQVGPIQ